jgi:hypothetical protein
MFGPTSEFRLLPRLSLSYFDSACAGEPHHKPGIGIRRLHVILHQIVLPIGNAVIGGLAGSGRQSSASITAPRSA